MTPAQILATTRAQIDETTANFYSDDEIYAYMWQSEILINNETESAETTDVSINTVINTAEYAIPTDCLFIKRVWWDSNRLQKVDFRELENQEGLAYGHTIASGQPYAYYQYGAYLGFYPTPNAVKNVKIWYVKQPTVITSSSTVFSIPQLFHHLIPDYCLWRMWGKDQEENRASFHKALWESNLQTAIRAWWKYKRSDKVLQAKDSDRFPNTYAGMI
jgi:hypothetical protein